MQNILVAGLTSPRMPVLLQVVSTAISPEGGSAKRDSSIHEAAGYIG
jgi:hypothetical protein